MQDLEVGFDLPAQIGATLEEVMTPALLIDLDAFERNCARMRTHAEAAGVRLRPHAKTHKSADIARYLIAEGGACGICCQKLSEAEAMVRAGLRDILITNEITDPARIQRLARLAGQARIIVCVDDSDNVAALSAAMTAAGTTCEVLVEIDCGQGRCGVAPSQAVPLAARIAEAPGLVFAGLQAYLGNAQHIVDRGARERAVATAVGLTRSAVAALDEAGLACGIVGGAGTGTYDMEAASGVYNEIQCGSYIFMDADYGRVRDAGNAPLGGFEHALFVLTQVMSRPEPERPVCDAGLKALAVDSGLPIPVDVPGLVYAAANDEHGVLHDPLRQLKINDRIRLIPGHCDPTCNLHDWFVGMRNGRVEVLWPITARGKVF